MTYYVELTNDIFFAEEFKEVNRDKRYLSITYLPDYNDNLLFEGSLQECSAFFEQFNG